MFSKLYYIFFYFLKSKDYIRKMHIPHNIIMDQYSLLIIDSSLINKGSVKIYP